MAAGFTLATNLTLDCKLCFSRVIARKNKVKILADRSEPHQSKFTKLCQLEMKLIIFFWCRKKVCFMQNFTTSNFHVEILWKIFFYMKFILSTVDIMFNCHVEFFQNFWSDFNIRSRLSKTKKHEICDRRGFFGHPVKNDWPDSGRNPPRIRVTQIRPTYL